ncbi:nucleolar protein 5 nucleolar protein nop5 nop58 [Holotrichia oblita]|uniref:Nucleolar protein 5 nucleolar protein nop5 nop58 n=2 Tax=Holotrichia oblita TaxID=644536 RepID=A0ACB9TU16_HOLOL|nr:nucleolar protein 5 nucleolar protein nop5 nop58 [Holotrichia oblita]KAI4470330.1 nucleolar protein 5 nucleolar protein nop5 nop58 [Holotrichia oblita]
MLILFETAAGYAIFKLLDENKLNQVDNLYQDFESPEAASKIVKLKHFEKFTDTTEALAATTAAVEGKLSKSLKKVLKKFVDKEVQDKILVGDSKLGSVIKEKFSVQCLSNTAVQELMRCIRGQLDSLIAGLPKKENIAMVLGLAHSLSRYKLKFSPDKVDTMIVQAVCLLDDLDKELNNYTMRCREWYGWHFPELGKVITDNVVFAKTVKIIGTRENATATDLSDILPEDIEQKVKEAAEMSMGTEISENDILNIQQLCDQIIEISNYRGQLYDYLRARMMAMAPNLTVLVGELVGARLISHAGSLINLAKHPASTVQILGAEKALFRALKTKKDTPKYGLIYHAQLIGQSSARNKGKMSRMLAAKAALATRVDALGEDGSFDLGTEHKVKLEARLRMLEEGNIRRISGTGKAKAKFEKYHGKSEIKQYPAAADSTLPSVGKRKRSESSFDEKAQIKEEIQEEQQITPTPKQKKKKIKEEQVDTDIKEEVQEELPEVDIKMKKKKKKKQHVEEDESKSESGITPEAGILTFEKKKKKQREADESHVELETTTEDVEAGSSKAEKKKERNTYRICR